MTFKPVSTTRDVDGNTGRITAAPRFLQFDGISFTPIDDQIITTLDRGYIVRDGQGGWVQIQPDLGTARAIGRGITREAVGRHFGPTVAIAEIPDFMRWLVTVSPDAKRSPNGDVFLRTINGVGIGMFFQADWGGMMTHDRGEITLDTRQRKQDALAKGETSLNLDPTAIVFAHSVLQRLAQITGWVTNRDAVSAVTQNPADFQIQASVVGPFTSIERIALEFTTEGVPAVSSAVLKLVQVSGQAISKVHVSQVAAGFASPITTLGNYGACKTAYETDPIGVMSAGGLLDVTAKWTDPFEMALVHTDDEANVTPSTSQIVTMAAPGSGVDEPTITYTALATILGFGRQHRGFYRGAYRGHT